MHRSEVIKKIDFNLRKEGHEIPAALEEIIQGIYNDNCEGYSAFLRKPQGTKPIFKSKNKNDGYWSIHPDYEEIKPYSLEDF